MVARYRTAPADADDVARLLVDYAPQVRDEPGCVSFVAARSPDDPASFVLLEHYRDQSAFDQHVNSEHYAAVARDKIRPLLTERAVEFYDTVE
ncbi:quinol monooxygenase YgiN [Pseudonocardia endophytica]|uniref:Quinol monooxygenase YgiN n=1 Tax=Pseudonocardia endophytica TaxID=401976 RepID=A0A4R1HYY6_PSEEN|nr:quinol monooxygenase YgiN [Pseudonocardia endophytica]